ncbi:hypothetical protein [Sulfurimonas indica]|uniref:hypothetical protein n=1 Tax=Sulfurimonas indica TaxID=2508707 RepID=UPI001264C3AD|nr:hypothetical protein [Sulfurimonas indica]
MKKLYLLFMALFSMSFVACSNMEIGFEEESIFYRGGVVYIYLDEDMKSDAKYRVYINNEDTEISLIPGYKTRFGIKPGDTHIEIVHGRESAAINMHLEGSKNYYLRVQKAQDGQMEIAEVKKDSIDSSVQSTPLYVDENEEKSEKTEAKVEKSADTTESIEKKETPQKKTEQESIDEKSVDKPKEGETTFYYDPLEGE